MKATMRLARAALLALVPGVPTICHAQAEPDYPAIDPGTATVERERLILRPLSTDESGAAQALASESCAQGCITGTADSFVRGACRTKLWEYRRSVRVGDCEFGRRISVTTCEDGRFFYRFPSPAPARPDDGAWDDHSWGNRLDPHQRHLLRVVVGGTVVHRLEKRLGDSVLGGLVVEDASPEVARNWNREPLKLEFHCL